MDNRPIGIFDSGFGGLTILEEYVKELPNEDYIYVGDNARVPYGNKSKETIIQYSRQIIKFLISKNVKLIIIACGTASANAFEVLKNEFSIPIQTVIEPIAKQIKETKIGVIATKSTIASHTWENRIHFYHPDCKIYSKACPLFVPIVEENLVYSDIAKLTVKYYLEDFISWNVESLILGCTHYPLLTSIIRTYLPPSIKIINISQAAVQETKRYLMNNNSLCLSKKLPERFAYTTDCVDFFKQTSKSYCSVNFHTIEKINLENYS